VTTAAIAIHAWGPRGYGHWPVAVGPVRSTKFGYAVSLSVHSSSTVLYRITVHNVCCSLSADKCFEISRQRSLKVDGLELALALAQQIQAR